MQRIRNMNQDTKLTRIVIGLIFLVVVAYMVLSVLKTVRSPYQFETVYEDVVEESIAVEGWLFRDEVRLDPAAGLVNYHLAEGEKVAAGEEVAVSYQNQQALKDQQKVRDKTSQLEQLQYARSEESASGKNLDKQINATFADIQRSALQGDYTRVHKQSNDYKQLVLRRECLYTEGAAADLGMASLDIANELNELKSTLGGESVSITAPERSGIFSTYVDGYEDMFTLDSLEDISPSGFKTLVEQVPAQTGDAAGKVVTSSVWDLVMLVKEEDLPKFTQETEVSVRFSALTNAMPMEVKEVGYAEEGEAVVVLESRKNMVDTIAFRQQSGLVIFESEKGILIPKNALRVDDSERGVFTVTGRQAEFKPITVVAEDAEHYIVKANPKDKDDRRILRSGDEVIIGKDLYEGKVVR